jgi:mitochondrial import inner membrane translocase subunit TIM44
MKESIKKFREEAKKLEEAEALKEARRKYVKKKEASI